MSELLNTVNSQQVLERLGRHNSQGMQEISIVASPGARVSAWAIKVKSHSSYNVYNVRMVVIGVASSEPNEIGDQMKAFNLAESFTGQGQLSTDVYAIMFKVGDKNAFYVEV